MNNKFFIIIFDINLLNIERIVLGGEIMEADELILEPIIESAIQADEEARLAAVGSES